MLTPHVGDTLCVPAHASLKCKPGCVRCATYPGPGVQHCHYYACEAVAADAAELAASAGCTSEVPDPWQAEQHPTGGGQHPTLHP